MMRVSHHNRSSGSAKRFFTPLLALIVMLSLLLSSCALLPDESLDVEGTDSESILAAVPAYTDKAYVSLNGGVPLFTEEDLTTEAFETYAALDALGRCGVAYANVCRELMPTEDRESISSVKPSGWQSVKYDIVEGKNLYNRCHLIGFQLTGENANKSNLITGTRYLNIQGMLPFENMVADYVKETENHVLYRATPIFSGEELVARGVLLEGYSVEDGGEGISFFVFCYNVQPGIEIDYATGESRLAKDGAASDENTDADGRDPADDTVSGEETDGEVSYILNTSNKKFHTPSCSAAASMKEENKREFSGTREELIEAGYTPCGSCKP